MTANIFELERVLKSIPDLQDGEEKNFSDVEGWEGTIAAWTDAAILLERQHADRPWEMEWVPIAQLRLDHTGRVIYVANWLIRKYGW